MNYDSPDIAEIYPTARSTAVSTCFLTTIVQAMMLMWNVSRYSLAIRFAERRMQNRMIVAPPHILQWGGGRRNSGCSSL